MSYKGPAAARLADLDSYKGPAAARLTSSPSDDPAETGEWVLESEDEEEAEPETPLVMTLGFIAKSSKAKKAKGQSLLKYISTLTHLHLSDKHLRRLVSPVPCV